MFKRILFILFLLPFSLFSQRIPKMLLLDQDIQIESTEAVNAMYNFKFETAEAHFRVLKQQYPDHPLAYFLMGLSAWWKMMPNFDHEPVYDDIFIAYMDTSIAKAEKLYKANKENHEAIFFLAGAYGFKARLYGERQKFFKAAFPAKEALHYLGKLHEENEFSPEVLFGKALFNYYEVWIRENYTMLRPMLALFPNGDKELGLKQLKETAYNAFYTRTEAQYFLMRIYYNEEEDFHKAFPVARYLATTFPDNPYFHRMYAQLAFLTGHLTESENASKEILERVENKMPGYEDRAGRYASYFLGIIKRKSHHDKEKAKEYFKKMIVFSEKVGATNTYYYYNSLANLAQMAHEEGDFETAKQYYRTIHKKGKKDNALYDEAEEYLTGKKKKKQSKSKKK